MGHVITRSQTSHKPCCRINDSLQRCQCRGWKPDKDSVTVVKTRQNESRHQSCSDVTAKLLSYRTQTMQVWFWGTPYAQVTWYCACAVNFVAFAMGKRYFLPITWLNLRRIVLKVTKWIEKLGSWISKMWIIFALPPVTWHVTCALTVPGDVNVVISSVTVYSILQTTLYSLHNIKWLCEGGRDAFLRRFLYFEFFDIQ